MSKDAQILIVEDNPRNLKLARDVLGHHGFRTLEAEDAEQGLALARSERPALILMDVQLPGMDGVAALDRLRRDPRDRGHPRDRAHRLRDAGRPRAVPRRRLRRLPRETDRRARRSRARSPPCWMTPEQRGTR